MKIILSGNNDFEIDRQVQEVVSVFDGEILRFDESNTNSVLFEALNGQNIFFNKKLFIIKDFSSKHIDVDRFIKIISSIEDDIILVQPEIDKRTKTYKDLVKVFKVSEINNWTDKDLQKAIQWTNYQLEKYNLKITKTLLEELVKRSDFNQRIILSTIEKMSLSDKKIEDLSDFIEPLTSENIFNIFETVLFSDKNKVKDKIESLMINEDPYKLFGLLAGQMIVMMAIKNTNRSDSEVAKDLNASPFMVGKLSSISKKITPSRLKNILNDFAHADLSIKNTNNDPWSVLASLLKKISMS